MLQKISILGWDWEEVKPEWQNIVSPGEREEYMGCVILFDFCIRLKFF